MKIKQIRVDGYKNLINCELNLGDFNVLVGPNNSGKSNFLEAIQMIRLFCFGSDKTREIAFKGFPLRLYGNSIPHIKGIENKDLSIGISVEMKIDSKLWLFDYDFKAHRKISQENDTMFIKETIQGKPQSQTGKRIKYVSRDKNKITIKTLKEKKKHNIANNTSSLIAMNTLYPNFEGLPEELIRFILQLYAIAFTHIFLFSPDSLRESLSQEESVQKGFRESSLNILDMIDEINNDKGKFELFKDTLCNILGLENFHFISENIRKPSSSKDEKKLSDNERILRIYLKRYGSEYAPIGEFSDGTLVVVAILSAFLSNKIRDPILCIEELENCLHPSALKKLIQFLQDWSNTKQVLITTHSPYVLNCVNPEDVNVAIVDQSGATHFKKVENTKQLRDYLKTGFMSFGDMLASNFEDVLGK